MNSTRLNSIMQNASIPLHKRSENADEVLVKANADLSGEIARLRLRILELEHAADTDPLVPVYNLSLIHI